MEVLQLIENFEIGGAQKTANSLMHLEGVNTTLLPFDQVPTPVELRSFDCIILHVWCLFSDKHEMNWSSSIHLPNRNLVVFNHDWRGVLNYKARLYIVYSEFARRHCIADSPIEIIAPGINLHAFNKITSCRNASEVTVGRLSTMHPGKISPATLGFWEDLPATRFLIGGDGSQLALLVDKFSHDSRFEFHGAIKPVNVPDFLSCIDIFLYDTNWHIESFGYVFLEAMAAGCVIVARAKGAVTSIIQHGTDGFLYTTNQQALTLCSELINSLSLRTQISANARRKAQQYSSRRFLDKMARLVIEVAGK